MLELQSIWEQAVNVITSFQLKDAVDILAVAYLIYQAVRLVRETRAMQLIKGIVGIFAVYFVAWLLRMTTLTFIIRNVVATGITVLAIVFQPELRRALEQLGRTKLGVFSRFGTVSAEAEILLVQKDMIDSVCKACAVMSPEKVGALMVIERETKIGEIVKTGTIIDAVPSAEMITNIFFHNSPLHDGALVIREGRLLAAGCFLPLSDNMEIGRELGTRHRAALGMSEVSDAVVVVVSEETGAITAAAGGKLFRKLSVETLRELLIDRILPVSTADKDSAKEQSTGGDQV